MKINIHGQEVDLMEIGKGEHVTDVIVIARAITPMDNGQLEDSLYISTTPQTTWLIQSGMIHEAIDVIRSDGE